MTIDFEETTALGLKLVRSIVRDQLLGTIRVTRDQGTEIVIEFKLLSMENEDAQNFTKTSRSASSQKIFRRSIPRTMMWCSAPVASILAFRGMAIQIAGKFNHVTSPMPPVGSSPPFRRLLV